MDSITMNYLLSTYGMEKCSTTINKNRKSNIGYTYAVDIKLDKKDTQLFIDRTSDFQNDSPKIYINDFPKGENKILENNKVSVFFDNKLVPNDETLFFKDSSDFEKYLNIFFSSIKIEDLCSKETKIVYDIYSEDNINFSSSIFSDKKQQQLGLYSIFKNERFYKNQKIIGVIEAVPKVIRNKKAEEIIEGFLSIISDRTIGKEKEREFVISLGKRSYITVDQIVKNDKVIETLFEIEKFIFVSSEKYYDRLNIFRNIFSDKIENKVCIDDEVLKQMLDDTKLHYNLFIGDKIKHFIIEKQKVTEDYLKLSENIVKRINVVTEEIPKQLLTIIGVMISTFFLKGIDQSIKIWIVPSFALLYLIVYLWFRLTRGWFFESENLMNQKKLMDESYEELYTLDAEFIKKLNSEYLKPKLKELKKMEILSLKVTCAIFCLIVIWFLWA